MNAGRTRRRIRRALAALPEAERRRRVLVRAGWSLVDQPTHDGDTIAVAYATPRPTGAQGEGDDLIAACTRALTAAMGGDFKVENHAGDFSGGCPTGLLGRHVHVMDK